MFKLTIKNSDDSVYWIEQFATMGELSTWLTEEKTRPYWDNTRTEVVEDITPSVPTPSAYNLQILKYTNRATYAIRLKAEIATLNDNKSWNAAQVTSYLSDPTIQQATGLIDGMSFGSALAFIQAADLTAYYNSSEKQTIVDLLTNYLASE